MSEAVEAFAYHVPQAALDDLNARLDNARWPEREAVVDWSQGGAACRAAGFRRLLAA